MVAYHAALELPEDGGIILLPDRTELRLSVSA
jgi:hypothetical protein